MRRPKLIPEKDIVVVEWLDALSNNSWCDEKDIKEFIESAETKFCFTIGVFNQYTKKGILIMRSLGCWSQGPLRDGLFFIPWGMVKSIKKKGKL